jgi:hypothetical protein
MTEYEYGVMYTHRPDELHRGPWSESKVDDWIAEAIDDGFKPGVFVKVHRPVHPDWIPGSPLIEGEE